MRLISLETRLRSVTLGYGLRLRLFSLKIKEVTVVTVFSRARVWARGHAMRKQLPRTENAPNECNECNECNHVDL